MPETAATQFPLVEMHFVANAGNEWTALSLRLHGVADMPAALASVFGTPGLLDAIAPLDCVLQLDSADCLAPEILELLPAIRMVLVLPAAIAADAAATAQACALHKHGYRVLLDGPLPPGVAAPPALRAVSLDCSKSVPDEPLFALARPHLARRVDTGARLAECIEAGFNWFSGDYPLHPSTPSASATDGTSRRRLTALLALLARDADSRELEALVKQDAALSFHLLKLVNSAAFAVGTHITSFAQAISLLGRRQLQRWLQLLLYARQHDDGQPNLLLPLAALRGALLETLCRADGGDRDAQDLAFMTGVFSLLDRLFAMPMQQVVGALNLPPEAADALLRRAGPLGKRLQLAEAPPGAAALTAAGIDNAAWYNAQLQAFRWAIQVARNV